ncbi:hypothetical protein DXG01_016076 [Tephrocybe rancida]|nr:hypothetical protein DXG01_016076 [Tephrocybe rancida]
MQLSSSYIILTTFITAAVSVNVAALVNRDAVPFTDPSLTRINTTSAYGLLDTFSQTNGFAFTAAAIPGSPISQAIISGDHLYISGFLPLAPYTGALVGEDDVVAQTLAVLSNIKTIIEYTGSNLGKVVKTTLYLKNIDDYGVVNDAYAKFFGTHRPARTAIAAASIPLGVLVEIDAIVRM